MRIFVQTNPQHTAPAASPSSHKGGHPEGAQAHVGSPHLRFLDPGAFYRDAHARAEILPSLTPRTSATCWISATISAWATTKNQLSGYGYDAAGNMTSIPSVASYTYNAEGQMTSAAGVTYTGACPERSRGNGDDHRVQKSNGKLYWYGAGGEILDETDASGNLTNEYVYFGGKRIARRDSSNNIYYYFADHLGSARVITQPSGTICYDADYDPFGKEVVITNTCPQSYKFSGKERDTETNLDDFGARYYSSQFERWISPDWSASPSAVPYAELVNPQSLNLYSYVRNNPVTSPDLDGHMIAQATMDRGSGDLGMGIGHWSPTTGPDREDNAAPEFGTVNNEQNTDTSNQPTAENSGDSADPAPDPQAQQQTPQQQVPPEVKAAIADSVKASNSPTADDKQGGFHEEGGIWGTSTSGSVVVVPAKPGPYSNPAVEKEAHIEVGDSANPKLKDNLKSVDGTWHVHPSGSVTEGNQTKSFVQRPSKRDQANAIAPTNIVVGAADKRVYFYNASKIVREMSLNQFMKEP